MRAIKFALKWVATAAFAIVLMILTLLPNDSEISVDSIAAHMSRNLARTHASDAGEAMAPGARE
jgi:hypothetical protein